MFIDVHTLTKRLFPADERYELGSQTRRAAYSVVANIVEGSARAPGRDRLHFLRISWASLAEVGYCLHAAQRLNYLDPHKYQVFERRVQQVAGPLMGLIRHELGRVGKARDVDRWRTPQ